MSVTVRCPACGGAGWYLWAVALDHRDWAAPQRCTCCDSVDLALLQGRVQTDLQRQLGAQLANATFDTFAVSPDARPISAVVGGLDARQQRATLVRARAAAEIFARDLSGWLVLSGPPGVGKSHLAAAIANTVVARGSACWYGSAPTIIRWVRDGYRTHEASERLTVLSTVALLIIDDLGVERGTDADRALLAEVLYPRESDRRPTVVTTNLDSADIEPRLADRIAGSAHVLPMVATSYRRERPRGRIA